MKKKKNCPFKVGDLVRCKPGFQKGDCKGLGGGFGYKSGREFEIVRIQIASINREETYYVVCDDSSIGGIWIHALELVIDPLQLTLNIIRKEIYG